MRKIIVCSLVIVATFAAIASAEIVGALNISNANEENAEYYKTSLMSIVVDKDYKIEGSIVTFYDSLMLMQMALSRSEIDVLVAPECVGEYMLRTNPNYKLRGLMINKIPTLLAFGFLEEKKDLRDRFNKAIEDMEREGTIVILTRDFISGPGAMNPYAVEFEHFDGAETINIAVTGEQPPLDYVSSDGKPAGFNTAILAEIGKRLRVNINIVIVETGSRVMALNSGRADVVFWFQVFPNNLAQLDIPAGVITSTPYYAWNKAMLIGRK